MSSVDEDLASRGAPLEYWFLRLTREDLAFLVDFIIRRRTGQAEVRVSLWVRGEGRVARTFTSSWTATNVGVIAGDNDLTAEGTRGSVDDVQWDLRFQVDGARAAPRVPVLSRLHPFDQELVSRPAATFHGRVTIEGEQFDISAASGCVTHYWGRRLPDRWHWISASCFCAADGHRQPDLALEAVVLRTRLWGVRPSITAGYLWLQQAGRQRLLISPFTSVITASGRPGDLMLTARSLAGTIRVHCAARADQYNDLGEGIHQTLLGTCHLIDADMSSTRSGLEHRTTIHRAAPLRAA